MVNFALNPDVSSAFRGAANALGSKFGGGPGTSNITAQAQAAQAAQNAPPPPAAPPATAATGGAAQSASGQVLSPEDIKAIASGHIVPLLAEMLVSAASALKAGPPNPADYPGGVNDDNYLNDQAMWNDPKSGALPTFMSLATQLDNAQKIGAGQITLQDGTLITQEMLHSNDPYVAAQAKTAYENQSRKLLTDWNTTANQAGLDQYKVGHDATVLANDTATAKFNADLGSYNAGLDYDKTAISQASDAINRQLSGLAESRNRADATTAALQAAAPWATQDGKTDFSGNDFGGGVAGLVRAGGGDPSASLVKFPTTVNIDPQALMQQGDQSLGVTGALPLVPQMTQGPPNIAPPQYQQGPPVPLIQTPPPPTTSPPVDSIPLVPPGATSYDPAVLQQIREREQIMGVF